MTPARSDVIWNKALNRFQDATTRAIVSFRDAAERVSIVQLRPGDFRLQDATGRFIGVSQFGVASAFSWISPNKNYIRFTEEVEPHTVGESTLWTVNKVTKYEYWSGSDLIGEHYASLGYGEEYDLDALERERVLQEAYREKIALAMGIDPESIDRVSLRYFEHRYYTPLK